jgi:hypothetical protein
MKSKFKKFLVILLLFTSGIGFSSILIAPQIPNIMNECLSTYRYNPDEPLSRFKDCSVLPQSLLILASGVGLMIMLFLLKALNVIELRSSGFLLVAVLFVALELLFYIFLQNKYFYESQLTLTGRSFFIDYLFDLSSFVNLTISLFLIPKLIGQNNI